MTIEIIAPEQEQLVVETIQIQGPPGGPGDQGPPGQEGPIGPPGPIAPTGLANVIQTATNRWRFPTTSVSTNQPVNVGRCHFVPIATPAQSWNGIGLNIWTAEADVTIELGLYSDGGGYPGYKLFSGMVDASTTGAKIIDFAPVTVQAGIIWSAVLVVGGTGALRIASTGHTTNTGPNELFIMNHSGVYGHDTTSYRGGLSDGSGSSILPYNAPTGMIWSRWVPFVSIRGA